MDKRDRGTLGKGVIYQYLNTIISLLSGILFYVFIARLFSEQGVGSISLLLSIVSIFTIVFSLSIGAGAQHFLSFYIGKRDDTNTRGTLYIILKLSLVLSLLSFVTVWLLAPILSSLFFHTNDSVVLIRLTGVYLSANVLMSIYNGSMLGLQKFERSAATYSLSNIIVYGLPFVLLLLLDSIKLVIIGWTIGNLVGASLFGSYLLKYARSGFLVKQPRTLNPILKYSIPIFLSSALGTGASYADRFIVAFFLSLSQVGIYNYALLVSTGLSAMVIPVTSILLPKLSEFYAANDMRSVKESIRTVSNLVSFAYVPTAILIAVLSPIVLTLIAGPAYRVGSLPLALIVTVNAIFVPGSVLLSALSGIRQTKVFVYISITVLMSNVILSSLLVSHFELLGAAIGYSSIPVFSFSITVYFAHKYGILGISWKGAGKIWVSALTALIAVASLQLVLTQSVYMLPIYIVSGYAVYLISSRIVGSLSKDDISLLISVIPNSLNIVKKGVHVVFGGGS